MGIVSNNSRPAGALAPLSLSGQQAMAAFRQALLVGEGVGIPLPKAARAAIEAAYAFTAELQANLARFEAHARSAMPDGNYSPGERAERAMIHH